MESKKMIAICGEAGVGKDYMLNQILEERKDLHRVISCTTRSPRENEVEGKDYYFLSTEDFMNLAAADQMLEWTCFNGWYYGTLKTKLDNTKFNIGVFNPSGIRTMLKNKDIELYVFKLEVDDKTRLMRQLNREENPNVQEIIRRYITDWEDFNKIDFDYTVIKDKEEVIKFLDKIH